MPVKKKPVTSSKRLNLLLETMERLHHIKDLQTLLDTLLFESRQFTGADAGSIYLLENGKLKFSYVQNDTIFKTDLLCNKYIYSNQEIDIDKKSVAGYVAQTGRALMIKDAYHLEARTPYTFNRYFDEISAYRTRSMLIVPLKTSRGDVIGVLQLINSKTKSGRVVPFSDEHKLFVSQFTFQAAVAIERALTLRELVLRMVRLAELRDPEETQQHLYRVSSYAAEIYRKWADNHNVPKVEVTNYRDIFSVAAMLHDIGKVGIPDHILRKRGKLTDEEYRVIKLHTIYGEKLFQTASSELERMAHELILNHHEKWDGSGYPGSFDPGKEPVEFGKGKRGGEIPLSARIIALADVYDALINKRVYKDAWEEDAVLYYIKQQSGKHFDPEIVSIFFDIYDVIKAIRSKWS